MMDPIAERIRQLKKEKGAVILAHNYTSPEIQDVADYVGDSLGLSIEAANTDSDIIVFCGVSFMGETAKLLNPDKTVLMPEPDAHCAMAAMCTKEQLQEFKRLHPDRAIVGYVNSTAESKSEMDICCTSSNAVRIVESLRGRKILFVPDMNLGAYAASRTGMDIMLWNGFCPIHHGITVSQVRELKERYPGALIMAHPECRMEVLELADHIGSTESMVNFPKTSDAEEFIVLTEIGMKYRLDKENPGKRFYFLDHAICTTMKMATPISVIRCLEEGSGKIEIDPAIMKDAAVPVKKMIELS